MMKTGLDDGVPMTSWAISLWQNPLIIKDKKSGMSLRAVGKKYNMSHEKVRGVCNADQ